MQVVVAVMKANATANSDELQRMVNEKRREINQELSEVRLLELLLLR